jgi:hypothetical protein
MWYVNSGCTNDSLLFLLNVFPIVIFIVAVLDKDEEEGVQQLGKQLKLLPEENLKLLKYMWSVS